MSYSRQLVQRTALALVATCTCAWTGMACGVTESQPTAVAAGHANRPQDYAVESQHWQQEAVIHRAAAARYRQGLERAMARIAVIPKAPENPYVRRAKEHYEPLIRAAETAAANAERRAADCLFGAEEPKRGQPHEQ